VAPVEEGERVVALDGAQLPAEHGERLDAFLRAGAELVTASR
jgi:hypothetical protein